MSKKSVVGTLSLQPIKEIIAVVAVEPAHSGTNAKASSSGAQETTPAEKVVYEDQAVCLDSHEAEQLVVEGHEGGPLEQGILTGSSLRFENAAMGSRMSAEELKDPSQAPLQEEQASVHITDSQALAATLEEISEIRQETLSAEEVGGRDACEASTPVKVTEDMSQDVNARPSDEEDSPFHQTDTPESKDDVEDNEQEVELIDEIHALSEQAMTKTLVS